MLASDPSFKTVQQLMISDAEEGQRIDNFLMTLLKGLPKSRLYRIIRKGEVRVNKQRVNVNYRLVSGDCVRIPPVRKPPQTSSIAPSASLRMELNNAILYEDDTLLVVNKPEKLAVHGGSGVALGLIEAVRGMRPASAFLELVHRIDKDTSGCVMIAKKRSILMYLHNCLQQGTIKKRYYALVEGQWRGGKFVEAPLLKYLLPSGERMVKVDPEGKLSQTAFRILQSSKEATLLEATPVTGRTHQIRVHCAFMGHPILGDAKYGDSTQKRLFLHAYQLEIPLPDQRPLVITSPLPISYQSYIDTLFKNEEKNGSN